MWVCGAKKSEPKNETFRKLKIKVHRPKLQDPVESIYPNLSVKIFLTYRRILRLYSGFTINFYWKSFSLNCFTRLVFNRFYHISIYFLQNLTCKIEKILECNVKKSISIDVNFIFEAKLDIMWLDLVIGNVSFMNQNSSLGLPVL